MSLFRGFRLLVAVAAILVALTESRTFFRLGHRFSDRERGGAAYRSVSPNDSPDQWFVQRLDHFNDAEIGTWNQRYFVNDTFYKPGGPAFIQISGEGTADAIWMSEGQWITWAQEFNAICFQVEHRYYGNSHPTPDISVKNLQYLSSEQALADLASFRNAMVDLYSLQGAKWISFGGSYSGSLSAWFRLKYPHLVDGAVATSAPLQAIVDFDEYLGVVEDSLATYSSTCNPTISAAVDQIDTLLQNADGTGWDTITSKFRLCSPLDGSNSDDVTNLYSLLCGNFEGVVQYNKDNRAFEGALATNVTIDTVCGIMDDAAVGSELDRYAQVNSLLLDAYGEQCLDHTYQSLISFLQNPTWAAGLSAARQWTYQTCTEFGFYQSSDLTGQPFENKFPIDWWVKQCADVYGPKFNATLLNNGVSQTNTIYGSTGIQVTKVIFPNGSIDPWHALGITSDLSADATAVYINGTAHCADMYPSADSDPPQLVAARETIRQKLQLWITGS